MFNVNVNQREINVKNLNYDIAVEDGMFDIAVAAAYIIGGETAARAAGGRRRRGRSM